jgi:NADH-quinone oxidoreductase subunit N
MAGMALMLVGFAFKVGAVPFHTWVPDVYQGSPSPISAFMASGIKVAGFAGLLRVFVVAFGPTYAESWQPMVNALTLLSLVVGAVMAVVQTDVKRMLAYSSINHAGFILLGVLAATPQGTSAALWYLLAYSAMAAGSFGVVMVVARTGDGRTSLDDFRGLARTRPGLALVFAVFLLAQAGVPLTAGFLAKLQVITAAVDAEYTVTAVIAMLTAVVSAFLYLRIIVAMYFSGDEAEAAAAAAPRVRIPAAAGVALALCLAGTLLLGVVPGPVTSVTDDATAELVSPRP